MNQINIPLSEDEYQQLKAEAARKKKSLTAVAKEKIVPKNKKRKKFTEAKAKKLMAEIRQLAKDISKDTKGFDSVKALREIRYGQE